MAILTFKKITGEITSRNVESFSSVINFQQLLNINNLSVLDNKLYYIDIEKVIVVTTKPFSKISTSFNGKIKLPDYVMEYAPIGKSDESHMDNILDTGSKKGFDKLPPLQKKILSNIGKININQELNKRKKRRQQSSELMSSFSRNTDNQELKENLGRFVRIIPEKDKHNGLQIELGTIFEIVGTQLMYGHDEKGIYRDGIDGYRLNVVGKSNDFGTPCLQENIEFLDNMSEDEAIDHNNWVNIESRRILEQKFGPYK